MAADAAAGPSAGSPTPASLVLKPLESVAPPKSTTESHLADIAFNLATQNKRGDDETAKRGLLNSITREDEFKVLAARGCNRFKVRICLDDVGKALTKSLPKTAECSSAMLKHRGWPTPMGYRKAYGIGAGCWGDRALSGAPHYSLTVAEWPLSTRRPSRTTCRPRSTS